MRPYKHYQANVIDAAVQNERGGDCPADDSTIRRWKK